MEPLTAGAIATLALTKVFETTIEKLTEATIAKIKALRDKIWNKFTANSEAATAFVEVEKGSKAELAKVTDYLEKVMKSDPNFAQDVEKLAREIQQEINIGQIQGQNIQNIAGDGYQNIDSKAPIFQGVKDSPITINYNTPPS